MVRRRWDAMNRVQPGHNPTERAQRIRWGPMDQVCALEGAIMPFFSSVLCALLPFWASVSFGIGCAVSIGRLGDSKSGLRSMTGLRSGRLFESECSISVVGLARRCPAGRSG